MRSQPDTAEGGRATTPTTPPLDDAEPAAELPEPPAAAAATPAQDKTPPQAKSSKAMPAAEAPRVAGTSAARRAARLTRERPPAKPALSKKHKVLIGGGVFLVLAVAVAWSPVRRMLLTMDLDKGRQDAAIKLLEGWPSAAVPLFAQHLRGAPTPEGRAAAAYGLGLAILTKWSREDGLLAANELLSSGEDEPQQLIAKQLLAAAVNVARTGETEAPLMAKLVPLLILCVDAKGPAARLAGIEGLGQYPAPGGGCAKLIQVARDEKGEFREKALEGIAPSATPDALEPLLVSMVNTADKELAAAALKGFSRVRDRAETSKLAPLLDPREPEQVRLEVLAALAARQTDRAAGRAVARAFADPAVPVRLRALAAAPHMRMEAEDVRKIEPLIADPQEEVRLAVAAALEKLQDDASWQVLLGAVKKARDIEIRTLNALLAALGVRGAERNKSQERRDLDTTALVVGLLDTAAQAEGASLQALIQLTLHASYPDRASQRRLWSAQKWKAWQANAAAREARIQAALDKLIAADNQKSVENRPRYRELYRSVETAIDELGDCADKLCADDPEDKKYLEKQQLKWNNLKMLFMHSSVGM